MKAKNGIIIGLLVVLTSCIQSLNPLYTEKDLLFDSRLIGSWQGENAKDKWVFEKLENKEKSYILTHFEKGKKSKLIVHLLKLGDYMYLDFYPSEPENETELFTMTIFPVHTFSMIKFENEQLVIDFGFLDKVLGNKNIKLAQVTSSEKHSSPLITASTENLQKVFKKYVNSGNAFSDASILTKK